LDLILNGPADKKHRKILLDAPKGAGSYGIGCLWIEFKGGQAKGHKKDPEKLDSKG